MRALLDWEHAVAGSPLWDVGSLFRYARRYTGVFRDQFAAGYRAGGRTLRDDWYLSARLLDATQLVGILSGRRDLPGVFAECRKLIDALASEVQS